jgi:hypothetical protein
MPGNSCFPVLDKVFFPRESFGKLFSFFLMIFVEDGLFLSIVFAFLFVCLLFCWCFLFVCFFVFRPILHSAWGQVETVTLLLPLTHDINQGDYKRMTPLMDASKYKASTVVSLLLEHKEIDVDRTDENGSSALHFAAKYRCMDSVRALIAKNARLMFNDEGNSYECRLLYSIFVVASCSSPMIWSWQGIALGV